MKQIESLHTQKKQRSSNPVPNRNVTTSLPVVFPHQLTACLCRCPEQAKRLYVTGGMVNNRTVRMEAYRQAGQYRVDDVVFFLRLNHSHLLTSQARWRTELGYELTVSRSERGVRYTGGCSLAMS